MNEELGLKPCPFCGGEAKVFETYRGGNDQITVFFPACLSPNCADGGLHNTREAAAEWWNTRHTPSHPTPHSFTAIAGGHTSVLSTALPLTERFANLREKFGAEIDDTALSTIGGGT